MAYGCITDTMRRVLRPLVKDKKVWDLGAGDLTRSRLLVDLGAAHVVAVDKARLPHPGIKGISTQQTYFANLLDDLPEKGIDVAFVAWPANYTMGDLVCILEHAKVVIYIGSNTDGTACGFPGLFEHLLGRELLGHVPYSRNSLIAVGAKLKQRRTETPEELAALNDAGLSYEKALRLAIKATVAQIMEEEGVTLYP